jgi:hypothetical protein
VYIYVDSTEDCCFILYLLVNNIFKHLIMDELHFKIKNGSGTYNKLDRDYRDFLTLKLKNDLEIDRLEVYDLIMSELISSNLINTFEEVKYRITDGENPNKIMLEVINRQDYDSTIVWLLKNRIQSFIEEDFLRRFK